MNPKDHSLSKGRQQQVQPQQKPTQQAAMPMAMDANGYALTAMAQHGMGGLHAQVGDLRSVSSNAHVAAVRGFPTVGHNGMGGVSFDVRAAVAGDGTSNAGAGMAGMNAGWARPAGGMDPQGAVGGPVGWLDQQTGVQHPGGLAPGLVYASKAARQAANMENTT